MAQSVKHKRSSVVTNGAPKLPTTQQISVGELAINFADGYETLSTVNSNNEIATFSSDSVLDKKYISSGAVVDAISAMTVVIQEDEYVTAQALNDQNYRITELEETHVYPEDIPTESSIANSGFTKNALTAFTETDPTVPAWAKAANKPSYTASEVGAMATSERNNYLSTATTYFDDVEYDSNTKRINFKKNSSVIDYVDATAFIKDGMVSSVTVSNGNLVVSFNTEAGREDIALALTQIFNPNNYYDKTTSDGRYLSTATTIPNEESIVNSGFTKGIMVFTSGTGANSIVSIYGNNAASGELSYAEGVATSALSYASHAEGYNTVVGGDYTDTLSPTGNSQSAGSYGHAEGRGTLVNGPYGHAEGNRTFSKGASSHAEGNRSVAFGIASHAEGNMASATALSSHAEAQQTLASGQASHAEGNATVASGDDSHAEGSHTLASGVASHAEGSATTAAHLSHAEGQGCVANGHPSHSEGQFTYSDSEGSHAEGRETSATSVCAHAEGVLTLSCGSASHTEGSYGYASGHSSHAEGYSTSATSVASHAEGYFTIARNFAEHAAGFYNLSNGFTEGNSDALGEEKDSGQTMYSIGVGMGESDRKNAFEIMQNGDTYLIGVGSYNGKNYSAATTLQKEINNKLSTGATLDSIADGSTRKLSNYSLTSHTHSNYSLTSHTHSQYALTGHTHSEYLSTATTIPTQESIANSGFTKNTGTLTGVTINGSAATVSNGNASLSIELGGGSGLPAVTAADNGKILQVVNGQWQLVTPTVVYTGTEAPSNTLGNNGDIYLQTS